jgi:ketosteroid isomerase-like protein
MATLQDTQTFDWPAFKSSFEALDAANIGEQVAEDVVYTEVDSRTPPASPRVVRGLAELREMIGYVSATGLKTRITDEVVTPDKVAFTAECTYPDGKRVIGNIIAHVENGRISRMTEVQAFDE